MNGRNRLPLPPSSVVPLRLRAASPEVAPVVADRPRGGAGWRLTLLWIAGAALALVAAAVLVFTR